MDHGELLTRWTVRLAMGCYAAVLAIAIARRQSPATTPLSRAIWTLGCVLFAGHVLSAFAFYHQWSHQAAFEDTARQTEEAIGLRFGWGLYVNHLFSLVWIGDVVWAWAWADSHRRRPLWITASLHAFMIFIAINGLIVFKAGPTRWVSLGVASMLCLWWIGTLVVRQRKVNV